MLRIRWGVCALAIAGLCLAARSARAGEEEEDEALAAKRSCDRVKDVAFPAADQPDEAVRDQLRGCSSEDLLYGIGQPADPVKARACAYVEQAAGDNKVFGGSAILMTIYARGVGAAQNLDLAIRIACDLRGAPAEIQDRVVHLERLERATGGTKGSKVKFDLCDDVSSGSLAGHCAVHQQRMTAAKRDRQFAARLSRWTAPERAAFQQLRAAAVAFFRARSANEVDRSGKLRVAQQVQEEEREETAFGRLLDELDRGSPPKAADSDLAKADKELNATYQRVMKTASPDRGTVTNEGIRLAERTWPSYRDAWAAFVKVKYPKVDPTSIEARVTRERTRELEEMLPQGEAK